MNILKKIFKVIAVLIAIVAVASFIVSTDFNYEKSISINAPIDSVWNHTSTLEGLERWSPWNDYDPTMEKEFTGEDGKVGAKVSWSSEHEKVGTGSQTIAKIVPPSYFETDLRFVLPYESEAKGSVKLSKEGEQTIATWGFKSEVPRPFNVMMKLQDMESFLAADFNKGLNKLKSLCEQE